MKFVLVLKICSLLYSDCMPPVENNIFFKTHYDCALNGYGVAQKTFMELKKLENVDVNHIEKNKLVIKFECREIRLPDIIVPPRKPKLPV